MTIQNPSTGGTPPASPADQTTGSNHLRIHRLTVVAMYVVAGAVTYYVLSLQEAHSSLIALLSSGAIFATLGSAISAIGSVFERDLLERVLLDVDILFSDIAKQKVPWRRWPFLPRADKRKLLNGDTHRLRLENPLIPIDVGTHILKLDLPTVLDDFFDLPLLKNVWLVMRFRGAAHTISTGGKGDEVNQRTGMTWSDGYMAYECMFDIWVSILKFRLARYAIHFGSALTIASVIFVGANVRMVGG